MLLTWHQVLAIREGQVRLHGQPKLPTWTLLNATADCNDTVISVNGPLINWAVGDRIVIASSSFYATDTDEATITNITCTQPGCEVVQLTLDMPLTYTHLGEVVTIPGDDRGHVLDMRAEVAVLNRWGRALQQQPRVFCMCVCVHHTTSLYVCAFLTGMSVWWGMTALQTQCLVLMC